MKDFNDPSLSILEVDSHVHINWFEVNKDDRGIIIMCPEGCRRLLTKNGHVYNWDKKRAGMEIETKTIQIIFKRMKISNNNNLMVLTGRGIEAKTQKRTQFSVSPLTNG